MNIETMTSSNEVMKAKNAPESMPGISIGTVTPTNARNLFAPQTQAARSSETLYEAKVDPTVTTTYGTASEVWAIRKPGRVPTNPNLRKRLYSPTPKITAGMIMGTTRKFLPMASLTPFTFESP